MDQKNILVWTWCPRCTVQTDHNRIKRFYRCMTCGCVHIGAMIIHSLQEQHTR